MNTMSTKGTGTALVTPFDQNGHVDHSALERLVDHVIEGGVEYLVVLGTTAESATLKDAEQKEVISTIINANNFRIPMVLGMGGNNTAALVQKLKQSDLSAFSSILSVAPYYNKPQQEGLYLHFKEVIDACPIPVILYNVPGRTSSNISADTCLRLAHDSEKVIAVKEASGDMGQIMQIVRQAPDHFSVLSGDDNLTLPMISVGAKGVISVSGQLVPKDFSRMVRAALRSEMDEARRLHYKLYELTECLFEEGNPAGVKAGLAELGICNEWVRLPLSAVSQDLKGRIANLLKRISDA